jgi:Na+-translocating ferredoxin:NAD+ oxidoreductase RnfD subunit
MGLRSEAEYFPGFGKKQILQAAVGILLSLVAAFLVYLLWRNSVTAALTAISGVFAAVLFTMRGPDNLSVCDHVRHLLRYFRSQKYYAYVYNFEFD